MDETAWKDFSPKNDKIKLDALALKKKLSKKVTRCSSHCNCSKLNMIQMQVF